MGVAKTGGKGRPHRYQHQLTPITWPDDLALIQAHFRTRGLLGGLNWLLTFPPPTYEAQPGKAKDKEGEGGGFGNIDGGKCYR